MITVTFTAHPIVTAPKDRRIALLEYEQWDVGAWSLHDGGYWCSTRGVCRRMQPTHWAEIDDMKPVAPTDAEDTVADDDGETHRLLPFPQEPPEEKTTNE